MTRVMLLAIVAVSSCSIGNAENHDSAAPEAADHAHECTCPGDVAAPAAARRLFASHTTEEIMECAACPAAEADPTRRLFASHTTEEEMCPAEMAGRRRLMASHDAAEEEEACCCPGACSLLLRLFYRSSASSCPMLQP